MGISNKHGDLILLVRRLLKIRPKLRNEPPQVQQYIAELLLLSKQKNRQHRSEAGHMVIYHQEIYENIAKGAEGFEILTARYSLMESPGAFSFREGRDGEARAFKVVDDVAAELDSYFAGWRRRQHRRKHLTTKKGEPIRLNAAITSKDADGADAKAEGKALVANYVEINVERMDAYCKQLSKTRDNAELRGQRDIFAVGDVAETGVLLDLVGRMMEATFVRDGKTILLHTYIESAMGRLYAQGMNLQNIKKVIRNLVLAGYWDYDIESCHHSILYQLAAQHGLTLPAVGHYLANKNQVRQQIATEVGITVKQAKTVLTMMIYGAHQSQRNPEDSKDFKVAIPKAIGAEKAGVLYAHPIWQGLHKDLVKARSKILKNWPDRVLDKKRNMVELVNLMDKKIDSTADRKKILAHILQGVEAKMLEVVRLLYPDTLDLLVHDGFVSKVPLDVELMEETIATATGFLVTFAEPVQIQPSADMGLKG